MLDKWQPLKLYLGILKLKETYTTLEELNFSDDILNELNEIIEDLQDLREEL